MTTSDDTIRAVVEAKRPWIMAKTKHAQKYRTRPHPPGKELVNGESVLYLGHEYQIELVDTDAPTIHFDQRFRIPATWLGTRKQVLRQWYLDRATEHILPRVDHFARQLGVTFANATIVDHRYRWGACTPQDNLRFNWRLIKAPMYVVDYVIIHELAHLLEANHTPRFWTIVRAQSPHMDKARQWLRTYGQVLEEEL